MMSSRRSALAVELAPRAVAGGSVCWGASRIAGGGQSADLTYPGDWKLDDEDTSFDLDHYFSIDGPETCHVIIAFFPPTLTEEACLDIQNETFTERMFKEAPTEAPFSTWGSLSYLLHDSARRQWQLIAARQLALTASKRDSTRSMNPQRTTAERRTRAPRRRRTVVPLPRPAGTAR